MSLPAVAAKKIKDPAVKFQEESRAGKTLMGGGFSYEAERTGEANAGEVTQIKIGRHAGNVSPFVLSAAELEPFIQGLIHFRDHTMPALRAYGAPPEEK